MVYQQIVTAEGRVAQALPLQGLMGRLCFCTLSNHDWEQKCRGRYRMLLDFNLSLAGTIGCEAASYSV